MPAGYGSYYELIQGKDYVALRYEMIHEHRVVPIDRGERRPHVGKDLHLDLGDARGWYEGNTLVIETTNFTERSAFRGASENLKMTERFVPIGPGHGRVARDLRRSAHVGAAVDVCDDPEAEDARRAGLRIRVPRRQLRPKNILTGARAADEAK